MRDKRLESMVRSAYEESPFYQDVLEREGKSLEEILERWDRIPVVDKDQILLSPVSQLPYSCYHEMAQGKLLTETTSGSTGKCLNLTWRHADYTASQIALWKYRREHYGIRPNDKFCYFYTVSDLGQQERKEERYKEAGLGFSKVGMTEERIEEIYARMLQHQPKWMMSQPSVMKLFAQYLFENGVEPIPSLEYIEVTGELCTPQEKVFIERAFECRVVNQYGCNEVGTIAYECPEGNMHVMEDNVYAEICRDGILVEDGTEGDIVVTSKWNSVSPFIRYCVGDVGKIVPGKCSCGMHGKILSITKGRKDDFVRCRDGQNITAYEFIRIFRCISEVIEGNIYQFQVIQLDYEHFQVRIVSNESPDSLIRNFYSNLANPLLRQAQYDFEFPKELLPDDRTGKLRFFFSQCGE